MTKKASKTSGSRKQGNKKSGEKKLSAAELETYRNRLVALHTRIRGDVATMAEGTLSQSRSEAAGDLSAMPLHMADIGTDNFEREHTLSFIQSDSKTLKLIEEALARIKNGTYGICEDCGCSIPKVRLNVLPYTASCVRCVELEQQDR
jgi:RNA polymerase-binding transcription factor DksA